MCESVAGHFVLLVSSKVSARLNLLLLCVMLIFDSPLHFVGFVLFEMLLLMLL
jgi:hypothetical protein